MRFHYYILIFIFYKFFWSISNLNKHSTTQNKTLIDKTNTKKVSFLQRLVFNILIGNTDDHARNTSAFWDGKNLKLTPAYYDLCPQLRIGETATQAMAINGVDGNYSILINVLSISHSFQITHKDAKFLIEKMVDIIRKSWLKVCGEAKMTAKGHEQLWKKIIFNPFCFRNWH